MNTAFPLCFHTNLHVYTICISNSMTSKQGITKWALLLMSWQRQLTLQYLSLCVYRLSHLSWPGKPNEYWPKFILVVDWEVGWGSRTRVPGIVTWNVLPHINTLAWWRHVEYLSWKEYPETVQGTQKSKNYFVKFPEMVFGTPPGHHITRIPYHQDLSENAPNVVF